MEITLIQDFTSPQGRLYPAGSKYSCDRDTYKRLVSEGMCEALEGEKKTKNSLLRAFGRYMADYRG